MKIKFWMIAMLVSALIGIAVIISAGIAFEVGGLTSGQTVRWACTGVMLVVPFAIWQSRGVDW